MRKRAEFGVSILDCFDWPMMIHPLSPRLRAAGLHVVLSATVALSASLVVFLIWYPSPFATMAGATRLFLVLVAVDVAMGPALTAVAVSPGKPRAELKRDLAVIVVLQLAAFGYGIYTVALARPIALVFEVDRMQLVSAADIDPASLAEAPLALRALPWTGPRLLAAVKPTDPAEQFDVIQLGLNGVALAALPRYWRDYPSQAVAAWNAARPASELLKHYPRSADDIARMAKVAGVEVPDLRFLPLRARRSESVMLLAAQGERVVGFLPVDGFF